VIGIVIVGHNRLSSALLTAAKEIMKVKSGVMPMSYSRKERYKDFTERLRNAIEEVSDGDGVLVLTDMYGDTPTNAVLPLIKEMPIEVVTGVNLPMLLEALTHREEMTLSELAEKVESRSRQCIVNAGDYFRSHHV